MYICQKCKKVFERKSKLDNHIAIKQCSDIESFMKERCIENKHVCPSCNKIYKQKKSFLKHLRKCIIDDDDKNKSKVTNINNITNITNNYNPKIIINNNNFNFNLPGQETISHIDQKKLLEIFNKPFPYAMRELMRLIYFNEEIPENNKWCIAFPKDEYGALTYNHETENIERWITNQVVDENFENMMFLISPFVDQVMGDQELFESLNQKQKQNINLFYNYFGIDKLSSENPADFKNIKMMAYNNKGVPLELWNNLKLKGNYKH